MIDIKIGKLIEYNCGNCYGIEDFSLGDIGLSENDNYASYSGSTRDSFSDGWIFSLFSNYQYIKVSMVMDKLATLEISIPVYGSGKNLWTWFLFYCKESLLRFGDEAYIYQSCFSSAEGYFLNENSEEINKERYQRVFG